MAYTIVVGYDGSKPAKKALTEAIELAKVVPDAEVVVACGQDRRPGYFYYDDQPLWKEAIKLDEMWDRMETKIQEDLEEAVKVVQEAGVRASAACGRGRPSSILVSVARDAGAKLIVVGTHGSGKDEETTVMGSTTTELLHATEVPVLVVPR